MKCNVTSSGDLLIVMDSDDDKHTRVVRYSDTIQKQRIGFSEKEQPAFYLLDVNISLRTES